MNLRTPSDKPLIEERACFTRPSQYTRMVDELGLKPQVINPKPSSLGMGVCIAIGIAIGLLISAAIMWAIPLIPVY